MTMNEFEFTRPLIALMCAGAGRSALDMAIGYTGTVPPSAGPYSTTMVLSFEVAEHAERCWRPLGRCATGRSRCAMPADRTPRKRPWSSGRCKIAPKRSRPASFCTDTLPTPTNCRCSQCCAMYRATSWQGRNTADPEAGHRA